jgi:hypothetical protein
MKILADNLALDALLQATGIGDAAAKSDAAALDVAQVAGASSLSQSPRVDAGASTLALDVWSDTSSRALVSANPAQPQTADSAAVDAAVESILSPLQS